MNKHVLPIFLFCYLLNLCVTRSAPLEVLKNVLANVGGISTISGGTGSTESIMRPLNGAGNLGGAGQLLTQAGIPTDPTTMIGKNIGANGGGAQVFDGKSSLNGNLLNGLLNGLLPPGTGLEGIVGGNDNGGLIKLPTTIGKDIYINILGGQGVFNGTNPIGGIGGGGGQTGNCPSAEVIIWKILKYLSEGQIGGSDKGRPIIFIGSINVNSNCTEDGTGNGGTQPGKPGGGSTPVFPMPTFPDDGDYPGGNPGRPIQFPGNNHPNCPTICESASESDPELENMLFAR